MLARLITLAAALLGIGGLLAGFTRISSVLLAIAFVCFAVALSLPVLRARCPQPPPPWDD